MLAVLTALGEDADAITNFPEHSADGGPREPWPSVSTQTLVNTNLDSTAHTLAARRKPEDASLVLINARLLPGVQFRCDLPTEPGYTYTIQYAQDVANPAGWTTLLTNNATPALLSFTNTPA